MHIDNELYHHGILGMKWGVRRYQNADGSLTDAGKVRYNSDGTKKNIRKMSDQELNEANRRFQAEETYDRYTNKKKYKRQRRNQIISDTAIKLGASVAMTAAGTALVYELDKNHIAVGNELAQKVIKNCGLVGVGIIAAGFGGKVNLGEKKKK